MYVRVWIPRVSRKLIATFVAGALLAVPVTVLATHRFDDVPTGAHYHDDVDAIADAGVTTGCGGNNYCPESPVTRGDMAAFLNRLGSLDGTTPPSVNAATVDGADADDFARPLFAVVNSDGTLARGFGAVSSAPQGTGWYEVIFNRDVTTCAFDATVGQSGAEFSEVPGQISVVGRATNAAGVWIETTNSAGTYSDRGFHLIVMCPGTTGAGAATLTVGTPSSGPPAQDSANQP